MEANDFKPGIYLHYNSKKLYFGIETRRNNTSGEEIVCYDALYQDEVKKYCKPVTEFFKLMRRDNSDPREFHEYPETRFKLVQELPADTVRLLRPGALVKSPKCKEATHEVRSVAWNEGKMIALLETLPTCGIVLRFPLSFLLEGKFVMAK